MTIPILLCFAVRSLTFMLNSTQNEPNRSFLARFGATILRGGIAAVPNALFRFQGELSLTPQLVWFIASILSYKWDADLPYPSLKRMAEESRVSEQQLHHYKRTLVSAGWLTIINRETPNGGTDTNFYDFGPLFEKLEELLAHEARGRGEGYLNERLSPPLNGPLAPPLKPGLALKDSGFTRSRKQDANLSIDRKEVPSVLGQELDSARLEESTTSPVAMQTDTINLGLRAPEPHQRVSRPIVQKLGTDRGRKRHGGLEQIRDALPQLPPRPQPPSEEAREVIAAYVEGFSEELGDEAPLPASVSRILHVFQRSGADIGTFTSALYTARSRTREYLGKIRKRRGGTGAVRGSVNAFPYFAATLEGLLGLRSSHPSGSDGEGSGP